MKTAVLTIAFTTAFAAGAHAQMLNGTITFDGGLTVDTDDLLTASSVSEFATASVDQADGDFADAGIVVDATADFSPDWVFGEGNSPFWQVGGFTFVLDNSDFTRLDSAQDFIFADGTGVVSGNGFDPTPAVFRFSTQTPEVNGTFSYSATTTATPVPEPGVSGLLFASLIGLAARRRR